MGRLGTSKELLMSNYESNETLEEVQVGYESVELN